MNLNVEWIKRLEQAAIARNPTLATKLQPGLPESRVRRMLNRAKIIERIDPIVAVFTWKDGVEFSSDRAFPNPNDWKASRSFFPGKPYFLMGLEQAIVTFASFKEYAKNFPKIAEAVGRYFPIFCSESGEYLATDIKPSNQNRVLIINHKSDPAIREAYGSFDEFVEDAIGANTENRPLRCFQELENSGPSANEELEQALRAALYEEQKKTDV